MADEHRTHLLELLGSGLHDRQTHTADVVTHQVQRSLRAGGAGGEEQRAVDVLQGGVDRGALLGLVDHAPHLLAYDVAGDADAAGPADVERACERAVVAGVQLEAVDRPQLLGVRLLDGLDAVDLRQLGEQLGADVGAGAGGDVVEHDRKVGGGGDGLVVALEAERAGAVVVGRHRDDRVGAQRARPFGQEHRVARVVGARAGDDRLARRALGDRQLDQRELLLVGERRGLAGGGGDHEAVRAVRSEVVHQRHERLLVDTQLRVERRHDRRQNRP